ncbi:MAG: hypothetical protein Q4G40_03950 [Brachybacterium sp.]|nr:hypothetical protein [Brachybacterium sp.]
MTVHRKQPGRTIEWGGLTLSHPIDVLVDLGLTLDHDDLVIVLDHLLGPAPVHRTMSRAEIAESLEGHRGRYGVVAVRKALVDARARVESPGETRTRLLLHRAGFPESVPNLRVADPDDPSRHYRIDGAFEQWRIGWEYQGDIHRRDKQRWRQDLRRRDALASIGWDLRFLTAQDIEAPGEFLSALRRSFLRAGAPAPEPTAWVGGDAGGLGRSNGPRHRPRRLPYRGSS